MITLTEQPTDIADPKFTLPASAFDLATDSGDADRVHRASRHDASGSPSTRMAPASRRCCLPLDQLFEIRASAAVRALALPERSAHPGRDPAALPKARRDRLILGLRALDARLENASYRDIAAALFAAPAVSGRAWKSHDLRDRAIRLVQVRPRHDARRLSLASAPPLPPAEVARRCRRGVAISPPLEITIPPRPPSPPP